MRATLPLQPLLTRASAGAPSQPPYGAVFERDGARCSFTDPTTGRRCRETRHLALHHLTLYARGGGHDVENLTLHCRAYNALAAERDFGRTPITHRKDGALLAAYEAVLRRHSALAQLLAFDEVPSVPS